ncbi:MAG TPA: hypothetical protein VKB36_12280, partial [Vicinamibacterales bacterium]|nr:hypothetical protein [Vicinamibacterales bacterium]
MTSWFIADRTTIMSKVTAALLVAVWCTGCSRAVENAPMHSSPADPPVAPQKPHETTVHGRTLTDNYFWLRDRADPSVTAYLKAEDAYADAVMKPTAALQETLFQEMLGHIKQTDETVPYRENGYLYYSRTREGLQYPIYMRRRATPNAPDEVLLDQNELAKGHEYTSIGGRTVSDDGHLLAYSVDYTGYRQYTLRIKDLRTGQLLPDAIE